MGSIDVLRNLPPLPHEVRLWNDRLQEWFCNFSICNLGAGMTVKEADELAIVQVKKDPRFEDWS